MKRLDRNVSAFQSALEETPEVLHAICVHLSADVGFCVVNDLVDVVGIESPISLAVIGGQIRAGLDVLPDESLQRVAFAVRVTSVRTSPPRSRMPTTTVLPPNPRLLIFSRLSLCMNRALPPMKVSSASTCP